MTYLDNLKFIQIADNIAVSLIKSPFLILITIPDYKMKKPHLSK